MHRRIIYQSLAYAVPIVIAAVTTGELVAATNVSSYLPPATKVVQQPLAFVPVVSPAGGNADRAFVADTHQIVAKTVIYEPDAYVPFTPTSETITADKWWRELTIPTRRKVSLNDNRATFPIQPQAKDQVSWHQPLTIPTRLKASVGNWQNLVPFPLEFLNPRPGSPGDADLAFGASSPQIANRTIIYEESTTYVQSVFAEVITADKWYMPLEVPTRAKRLPQGARPFEARNVFPQVPWGWYEKLDDPTRAKKTLANQLGLTFVAAAPGAGAAYNWFLPLEIPTRARKLYEYPATAIPVYFTAGVSGDADLAFAATSAQIFNKTIVYEPDAYTPFTPAAETVTIDKWWRELTTPVRRKVVGDRAALTFLAAAPSDATTQNWFLPLEIPTRARKLYEFPYSAIPVYFVPPTPGAGFEYNWFDQLNEPVRPRRSILAAQQRAAEARAPFPQITVGWYAPLNERVRPRRFAPWQYWSGFTFYPTPTVDMWWKPLESPTRRTKPVPQQAGYTFVAAAPGRGVAYNWFGPLDTPMRRDWRRIAQQQGESFVVTGIRFPQLVSISVTLTVAFPRMLRYSCKSEASDGFVEQGEQTDPWSTQDEVAVSFSDEAEQSDPWSEQGEVADNSDEEDPNPQSGCE